MPKLKSKEKDEFNKNLEKQNYNKLLHGIGIDLSKKEKKVVKKFRTEPSKNVSMFSLNQSSKSGDFDKINLNQLVKNVSKSGAINTLKRKIDKVVIPSKKLSAPLSKPVADRIQRKVEYKKTSKDMNKWDPIVQKHRKADHISFPLHQEPFHIRTVDEFFKTKAKSLTPLEKEMYSLLSNNKCAERKGKELTIMEEEALAVQSLEEARDKLRQLRKHRVLLSQHEAKNKRQNKIKSRHYHRMLKKQKLKQMSKQPFEKLTTEAYDLQRAEERASLRHRKNSKWAKKVKLMSKHESQTRVELQEHQQKHDQLLKKQLHSYSSDESEQNTEPEVNLPDINSNVLGLETKNLWLKQSHTVDHENSGLQSLVHKDNSFKNSSDKKNVSLFNNMTTVAKCNDSAKEKFEESKKRFKENFSLLTYVSTVDNKENEEKFQEPEISNLVEIENDSELIESAKAFKFADGDGSSACNLVDPNASTLKTTNISHDESLVKQDINVVINSTVKPVTFQTPTLVQGDNTNQTKLSIEEAFADDDVVAEFEAEKNSIAAVNQSENEVDSSLPGWGRWGGSGVASRKKRPIKRRETIRRKDCNLGHVILNEERDAYITKHQVHKLPFPFTQRNQYENYIARPIGNTWNTPAVFSNAIKPKISNPLGVAITPLNSNELFTDQEKKLD